jgi:tripartite-type tricarboxylate transporter receptor subunit TctC
MNLKRREFALAMTLGSMGLPVSAQNSTWKPTDRITYVLGVTPGGSVDIYARGIQVR